MGRIADALAKAEQERKKLHSGTEHGVHVVTSRDVSGIDPHIVSYTAPQSTVAEQYRMLRTNLVSLNSGRPIQVLVITSAIKKEGKSITVLNLSTVMATDTEKKVVTIDCDLRRPDIHRLLEIDVQYGLSDFLRGKADTEAVLYKSKIPNLTVLPAGRPPLNPSELIGSSRMRSLIEELRKRFDYIVFDTPPVMAVTDAGVLGAMADGVLLVVKAQSTKRDLVLRAETLLKGANARVIGCVLTNIKELSHYYIYGEK